MNCVPVYDRKSARGLTLLYTEAEGSLEALAYAARTVLRASFSFRLTNCRTASAFCTSTCLMKCKTL